MTDTTIDTAEVAKFTAMAAEWWDPNGKFAPLHKFNPVRLHFIRDTAAAHFGREGLKPFGGLTLLDIGCGGGLLSEPMARLGFAVTGVDPSERNIGTAKAHADGLAIDYRVGSAEALVEEGRTFDVVLNMEVVEHVADLRAYLRACARLVTPGGLMLVATLNKTLNRWRWRSSARNTSCAGCPPARMTGTASLRRPIFAGCLKNPVSTH